jgi:hypothetical protein
VTAPGSGSRTSRTVISESTVKEHDIETLAGEAMRLFRLDISELYAILGGQLLGSTVPSRAAGIVVYLTSVRSALVAKTITEAVPSQPDLAGWAAELEAIFEELRRDGIRFLAEVSGNLRQALNNKDILRLSEELSPSAVRMIIVLVAGALSMPRELDPICATVTAVILRLGLRDFCK